MSGIVCDDVLRSAHSSTQLRTRRRMGITGRVTRLRRGTRTTEPSRYPNDPHTRRGPNDSHHDEGPERLAP
eukprot:7553707-Pyramimonas_sp.AAC.1